MPAAANGSVTQPEEEAETEPATKQQIQFMVSDAKVRFLFVGEQEQYDKARRVLSTCTTLERIIIFDKNVRISEHDIPKWKGNMGGIN